MKVSFSRKAQADIQAIHDYISNENPVAAKRVVLAIFESIQRLKTFPLSGRAGAISPTREIVVPQHPYIVVYQVIAAEVEVIAVFHAARDIPRG